jgi:hypothetical protein
LLDKERLKSILMGLEMYSGQANETQVFPALLELEQRFFRYQPEVSVQSTTTCFDISFSAHGAHTFYIPRSAPYRLKKICVSSRPYLLFRSCYSNSLILFSHKRSLWLISWH